MVSILHNALIIVKETQMCDLYKLYGSTIISHTSLTSQNLHVKTNPWHLWWLRHTSKSSFIELTKQYLIGKQHGVKFGSDIHNFKKIVEHVHLNL